MKYYNRIETAAALAIFAVCGAALAQAESLEKRAGSDYGRKAFQEAIPILDKAAGRLGEHDDLPKNKWFGRDQKSNTSAINQLLDEAMEALNVSEAAELRAEIREAEARIAEATKNISEYREKRVSAPGEESAARLDQYNPFYVTQEEYDQKIAEAEAQIEAARTEIEMLRAKFTESLREIGLDVTDETAESLLATVSGDDFITMCVVFDNLKIITLQLQDLVDQSGEDPAMARRYYGMYVVIAKILDRAQTQYIDTLRHRHIPMLQEFTEQARENIAEAKRLIRSDRGDKDALESNIEANELTIAAAGFYIDYLSDMIEVIEAQHQQTERVLATALNTYKTVDVSVNVGELIVNGSKSLARLMQLEMPELRAFDNSALRREYQRLSEKMRGSS